MIKALRTLTDDPVTTARSTRKTAGTTAVAKKQSPWFLQSQRLRPPWQHHPPGARAAPYKRRGLLSVRERERPCFFNLKVRWGVCYKTIIHFVEMKNPNRIINYCFQWEKKKLSEIDEIGCYLTANQKSLCWHESGKRRGNGRTLALIY